LVKRIGYGQAQRFLHVISEEQQKTLGVLAVLKTCRLESRRIVNSFSWPCGTGTFGSVKVIAVEQILGVAARVLDRGTEVFLEQPGSMDFFHDVTLDDL
jgi:hypothetical protein